MGDRLLTKKMIKGSGRPEEVKAILIERGSVGRRRRRSGSICSVLAPQHLQLSDEVEDDET